MTQKELLNNLLKDVADLTGMKNNKTAAINSGSYLILLEGVNNFALMLKSVEFGTVDFAFIKASGYYKPKELEALLSIITNLVKIEIWETRNNLLYKVCGFLGKSVLMTFEN